MKIKKKLAVIAIGGNSLIKDAKHQTVEDQNDCIIETSEHIVKLIEKDINVVITHGNGPQVGFILLRSEIAKNQIHEIPLPSAGADTQGAIGYQIQQAVGNLLRRKKIDKKIATIITQVLVDKDDIAFDEPSKPIGPFLTKEEAESKKKEYNWNIAKDADRGYRRVVASPYPKKIIELEIIEELINKDYLVITVGGGGIPVIQSGNKFIGVPAVIDKDFASAKIADLLDADLLVILTAVNKVKINFNQPNEMDLDELTIKELDKLIDEGHFLKGSMLPKIEAAKSFVNKKENRIAIIASLEEAREALLGNAGTKIKN